MKPLLWQDIELDPTPIASFVQCCKNVTVVRSESEMRSALPTASSVIVHTSHGKLYERQVSIFNTRRLPILWLCTETRPPKDSEIGCTIDELIFPGIDRHQLDWALLVATRTYSERKRWYEEKEQLLLRLEERKWVDQAKGILCEIKGISESEAYDFLRKQAMNERKRIGEVASSIVKVYQLIHG